MKNKRQIAFNKQYTLFFILGIILLILSVTSFGEGDMGLGIGLGLVSALFLAGGSLLLPCFYLYDKEGVTLVYVYMPNERYLWKNVYEIRVTDDDSHANRRSLLFFLVYKIEGTVEGKKRFYMNGHIQKSFRNKHLIQKYWDGTITGYFDDEIADFKAWRRRRKEKKQKQIDRHFCDEILPMERKARADLRLCLRSAENTAKRLGFTLRTEYRYVTDDQKRWNTRPKANYTYTAKVTLARQGEKNLFCAEAALLRVSTTKNGYRGIPEEEACEGLSRSLLDYLEKTKIAHGNA